MIKKQIDNYRQIFASSYNKKDFFKAIIYGEKLLELHKEQENLNFYEYCLDTYNVGFLNQKIGQIYKACTIYDKSINFFENTEEFKTNKYSKEMAEVFVDTLTASGNCHYRRHSLTLAVENFEKALKIANEHIKNSNKYLNCLHNLASTYYSLDHIDKSIELNLIALQNRTNKNLDYADNLNLLGYCYERLEDYNTAINYFNQAISIIKGLEGISSQDYMANIYYLATVYEKADQLEDSLNFYTKASNLIEKKLGENTTFFAEVLNKIGNIYYKLNQNKNAIEISLKALNITRNIFGESHIFYANNLKKIADIYFNSKDYEKALINYEKETQIKRNIIGETGELYIESLLNLVSINAKIKNLENLKKLCAKVINLKNFDINLEVYEKSLLILTQICIAYKNDDTLLEIYENYNNISPCKFSEMLNKAKNLKGGLFKSINIFDTKNSVETDILKDIKEFVNEKIKNFDKDENTNIVDQIENSQSSQQNMSSLEFYEIEEDLDLHPSLDMLQNDTLSSIVDELENKEIDFKTNYFEQEAIEINNFENDEHQNNNENINLDNTNFKETNFEVQNKGKNNIHNLKSTEFPKKEQYIQEDILNLFLNNDEEDSSDII